MRARSCRNGAQCNHCEHPSEMKFISSLAEVLPGDTVPLLVSLPRVSPRTGPRLGEPRPWAALLQGLIAHAQSHLGAPLKNRPSFRGPSSFSPCTELILRAPLLHFLPAALHLRAYFSGNPFLSKMKYDWPWADKFLKLGMVDRIQRWSTNPLTWWKFPV